MLPPDPRPEKESMITLEKSHQAARGSGGFLKIRRLAVMKADFIECHEGKVRGLRHGDVCL